MRNSEQRKRIEEMKAAFEKWMEENPTGGQWKFCKLFFQYYGYKSVDAMLASLRWASGYRGKTRDYHQLKYDYVQRGSQVPVSLSVSYLKHILNQIAGFTSLTPTEKETCLSTAETAIKELVHLREKNQALKEVPIQSGIYD